MNKLKINSLIAVIIMLSISLSLSANDTNYLDHEQNLLSSCNAFDTTTKNPKTSPCINYIEGFLNGVLNANSTEITTFLENNQKSATLIERAYANRVGSKTRNSSEHNTVNYACLSMDESRKLVIENLSDNSLSSIHSLKQLNARLVHVLKIACATENKSE
jgi:hypothetical protein